MSRWINKLWTKNDCGGLIPTRTTNHWPLRLFSLRILCTNLLQEALGEYQRQGEEAGLVIPIPEFASVIRLPGWPVGGLCSPTVTIPGRRGGSLCLSSSPEAPSQNQSSDFSRLDRCPDWLWEGRPRAVEEAVVSHAKRFDTEFLLMTGLRQDMNYAFMSAGRSRFADITEPERLLDRKLRWPTDVINPV